MPVLGTPKTSHSPNLELLYSRVCRSCALSLARLVLAFNGTLSESTRDLDTHEPSGGPQTREQWSPLSTERELPMHTHAANDSRAGVA